MADKNYNTEIISNEIRELISSLDQIVYVKDEIVENFKKAFLNCSTNN